MNETLQTVWITRYALSSGVFKAEGAVSAEGSYCTIRRPGRISETFHGKDWHLDANSAFLRANEMRLKKMVSLRKSLANLLHFNIVIPE